MDILTMLCIVSTLQVILYVITFKKLKDMIKRFYEEKRKSFEYFKGNK